MALPPCLDGDSIWSECKGIKENPDRTINNPRASDSWEDVGDGEWNVYVGEFKNGLYHGDGILIFEENVWGFTQFYDGKWKDGKQHGHGTYKYYDGTTYEGEWKDGKQHGQGAMIYLKRSTKHNRPEWSYVGGWKDGRKHGQGTDKATDGSTYEGGWKDGRKHGQGIYTSADGKTLESEFINGTSKKPED